MTKEIEYDIFQIIAIIFILNKNNFIVIFTI
jgi:hypothetical protein